jgi:hypothetical protein
MPPQGGFRREQKKMSQEIIHAVPKLKIDGKEYNFVYSVGGVKYIKERHGKFTDAIMKIDGEDGEVNFDMVAEMIYAGLMGNDNAPSMDKVKDWMDKQPIATIMDIAKNKITIAITATFPDVDPKKK